MDPRPDTRITQYRSGPFLFTLATVLRFNPNAGFFPQA
jgi:hypothetical protein